MENPDHNNESRSNPKRIRIEVNVANLSTNPGLRIKISNYHPNERDQIRKHYLQNKPCQPVDHDFPQSQFGKTKRRFNPLWFEEYHCGSKNILVGWNIALRKMLHIVYIVIYFDLILVIKEGETHLLLKDSKIGKKGEITESRWGSQQRT